jgi:hypothetical protein
MHQSTKTVIHIYIYTRIQINDPTIRLKGGKRISALNEVIDRLDLIIKCY